MSLSLSCRATSASASQSPTVSGITSSALQTSKPSFLAVQTHRNVDPLLRKQVVQLGAAQLIEKIGGRGGTRTRCPLLAKRAGENTKQLCWCRLHGNQPDSRSLKCPEVVPKFHLHQTTGTREAILCALLAAVSVSFHIPPNGASGIEIGLDLP